MKIPKPGKGILFSLMLSFTLLSLVPFSSSESKLPYDHEVYFRSTPYELNVYRIQGTQPGKALLIIGGIHNEPGGYLTADHYVDMRLEKGTLIVVPRANFQTIIQDKRGIGGDMNRKFKDGKPDKNFESKIVEILKGLIAESDILLNLHEGSGFFREKYLSTRKNPRRFGQSIIADTDVFHDERTGKTLYLKTIAAEVVRNVNRKIENKEYHFRFNDHKTFSPKTKHPEQRGSATYYALSNFGIPAFGIESSSDIKDIELKVRHQIWIINEFMRIYDIIPEIPGLYLDYPEMEFIVVKVNGTNPIVVSNKNTLLIKKNDKIEISHIEANYERGLSADVAGVGSTNDIRVPLQIEKPTSVIVRKDKFYCGEINIRFTEADDYREINTRYSEFNHIIIDIGGSIEVFDTMSPIVVLRGETIKIIDTVPPIKNRADLRMNFYGFVPKTKNAKNDDMNHSIRTDEDLPDRYSIDGKGRDYEIRLVSQGKIVSTYRLRLVPPRLDYITILSDNQSHRIKDGETIVLQKNAQLIIEDAKTNLTDKSGLKVNFKGFVGKGDGEDRNMKIVLGSGLLKRYSVDNAGEVYPITVSKNQREFGKVFVRIVSR